MIAPFDIFRTDDNGQRIWQAEAQTLYDTLVRVQQLGASGSAEYRIRSRRTG